MCRRCLQQLTAEYGRGFDRRNLFQMIRFAEAFPDEAIVSALRTQLSWSHFHGAVAARRPAETRLLRRDVPRRALEHADAPSQDRPSALRADGRQQEAGRADRWRHRRASGRGPNDARPGLSRPVFPRFPGPDRHATLEKDVEQAILRELEAFILEMGSDFAFVARQKRITVDNEDYYLDLLFYHRRLRRLVAIELKLGKFQAADKGQMELYLRWLEKHDTRPGEEPPLGLILCADKSDEHVELLQLDKSGIRVAQYLTELPPRELLEKTLHDSIRRARSAWLSLSRMFRKACGQTGRHRPDRENSRSRRRVRFPRPHGWAPSTRQGPEAIQWDTRP